MKRVFRVLLVLIIVGAFVYTLYYLYSKNQKSPIVYNTDKPFYTDIQKKSVATGSIIPREEVDIKPQVSGIVQEIYVEAGDRIESGSLIAKIKVIPDMLSLSNSENRLNAAKIALKNAKLDFDRNKKLFDDKVISASEFQLFELSFKNAKLEVETAQENLEIVKEGASSKSGKSALTLVKATVSGMVLDVPVKVGNQVIESNNFNDGTTVATIADMNDLIFEGKIDESEVGKIKEGMDLSLTIGAIENTKFGAILEYISPKGVEENGAIQFVIKAKVSKDSSNFIRAGYSANADIVLESRDSVLSVKESLIQYEDGKPFIEVKVGDQLFERKDVETGLSDGINVEVVNGVSEETEIKIWNRAG
jgi:HlyD family secretion protein